MIFVSAIVVAALVVPLALQQQTIKDLRLENEVLKKQVAEIAPLQEQVARATQDAANAGGGAEAQVRDLARLRGEVVLLRRATNELAKARQEIQKLKESMASEAEARNSAAALQAQAQQAQAQQAQTTRKQIACISNLRLFDSAKKRWAQENNKQATDTPTLDDLRPYLGRGPNAEMPTCPDGGVYTIGAVNEKPTCSISGHVLP